MGWLVTTLEVEYTIARIGQASRTPASQRVADDYYHLALASIYSPVGYDAAHTLDVLKSGLQLDPNHAPSLCAMVWVRSTHPDFNDSDEQRSESARITRRVVELAFEDAFLLGWVSVILGHLECDAALGRRFASRAVELNPYSGMARLALGLMAHYDCDVSASDASIATLSDVAFEPLAFILDTCRAMNSFQTENYDLARDFALSAVHRNPGYVVALRYLTASEAAMGRIESASEHATRLVRLDGSEHLEHLRRWTPYRRSHDVERLLTHLAQAGVPERRPSS